ncbi:MAG: hypothetical protein ACRDP7_17150 [Trebonia sp.]
MSPYPQCPLWCWKHADVDTGLHRSVHDPIPVGGPDYGFVSAYAIGLDDDPFLAVTTIMVHEPVDATLLLRNPDTALLLALLVERLSRATRGQHRVLAAQIRAAAKIITGTGESTPGTTASDVGS